MKPNSPTPPEWTCWLCSQPKTGKPAYSSVSPFSGEFHYCAECWEKPQNGHRRAYAEHIAKNPASAAWLHPADFLKHKKASHPAPSEAGPKNCPLCNKSANVVHGGHTQLCGCWECGIEPQVPLETWNRRPAAQPTPKGTVEDTAELLDVMDRFGITQYRGPEGKSPMCYAIKVHAVGRGESTAFGGTPADAARNALEWLRAALLARLESEGE